MGPMGKEGQQIGKALKIEIIARGRNLLLTV
jgi:hypothetical protein